MEALRSLESVSKDFSEEHKKAISDLKAILSDFQINAANATEETKKSLSDEINALKQPISSRRLTLLVIVFFLTLSFGSIAYGLFQHHKKTPPEREAYDTLLENYQRAKVWHYWLYDYALNSRDKNPITHESFLQQNPLPKEKNPFLP